MLCHFCGSSKTPCTFLSDQSPVIAQIYQSTICLRITPFILSCTSQRALINRFRINKSTHHTWYLSFVLHGQNFWGIKFTPKKRVNYDKIHKKLPIFLRYYGKIHSKLPIFRVKSVKIYTGQKNFTREFSWHSWQIWGMLRSRYIKMEMHELRSRCIKIKMRNWDQDGNVQLRDSDAAPMVAVATNCNCSPTRKVIALVNSLKCHS